MTVPGDSRNRTLLVIGPEPPPLTGMEIATQALVAELRTAGVRLERVNTADPVDELKNRNRWTARNVGLALRHLGALIAAIRSGAVGVVYLPVAQGFPALFRDAAFVAVAQVVRKPVVIHLHGGAFGKVYTSQSSFRRFILRVTLGRAALGIVLTERLRPELEVILPADRIVVVQNGVDLEPTGERSYTNSRVSILFLSSLYPEKGLYVFLEALSLVRHTTDVRGVVAGSWPSREARDEALALTERLSLGPHVEFVGTVDGVRKAHVFADADIFCLPSYYAMEGQPLVVIEAMAAGLPVVATRWRGIADTVVDAETGVLVDEARADVVAEALGRLAANPAERRRLGEAGRRLYLDRYTQHHFGERMLAALTPLLEESLGMSVTGTPSSPTPPPTHAMRTGGE